MRTTYWIAAGVLSIGLTAHAVMAADGEPAKAGKYQSNMINASANCTSPSETTLGALPFPACPASDPVLCTFGDKGQGKVSAKAKDDVSLQLQVKDLVNCEGATLQAKASFKSTTNNCSTSSRCTTISIPAFPIPGATCVVDGGKCKIKTTLNTLIPGALTVGENTAIELGTIGVEAGTAMVTIDVAVAGILVP